MDQNRIFEQFHVVIKPSNMCFSPAFIARMVKKRRFEQFENGPKSPSDTWSPFSKKNQSLPKTPFRSNYVIWTPSDTFRELEIRHYVLGLMILFSSFERSSLDVSPSLGRDWVMRLTHETDSWDLPVMTLLKPYLCLY